MLTTADLWFCYQEAQILKGLTLDFSNHAVTGLVGANGCGKSTLFMNLSGLLRPQQGAVLWQGEPLDYSKRGLRCSGTGDCAARRRCADPSRRAAFSPAADSVSEPWAKEAGRHCRGAGAGGPLSSAGRAHGWS